MITQSHLEAWASQSLGEAIKASPLLDVLNWQGKAVRQAEKIDFLNHLKKLRKNQSDFLSKVLNAPMNGSLSQGWRDLDKDTIFYQDCLAVVIKAYPQSWTPADYLLQCYIAGITDGHPLADLDLGRALRNLPSFIREELIAGLLSTKQGVEVSLPPAALNAQSHVDIILRLDDRTINVWSYLSTLKAMKYLTQKKITGRGQVLPGLNLLAPFDKQMDSANFLEWWVPSYDYIDRLLKAAIQPPKTYEDIISLAKSSKAPIFAPFNEFVMFVKPDEN